MTNHQPLVVSLLNTPAGRFAWWEEFPRRITVHLRQAGIEHLVGYKDFTAHSTLGPDERWRVHDEDDAPFPERLRNLLLPKLERYGRVIVHSHSYPFGAFAIRRALADRPGVEWWATFHATPPLPPTWRRPVRHAFRFRARRYPDRLFGCSMSSTTACRQLFPWIPCEPLLNGRLDTADLSRFEARGEARTAILVGRLVPSKGLRVAVEAAAMVRDHVPGFRLLVVGEGEELEPCRTLAAELGLGATVEFLGYQPDVDPFYAIADVVWVPSTPGPSSEGLPLTALEAKAHALPVLYTKAGGTPESQREGVTGLLIDPLTPATLAEGMITLARDRARFHRMRSAIADERCSWSLDRMAQAYARWYIDHLT